MPYGQWWRRHRRMLWQHVHPGAIGSYVSAEEGNARRLLLRILRNPKDLTSHIR